MDPWRGRRRLAVKGTSTRPVSACIASLAATCAAPAGPSSGAGGTPLTRIASTRCVPPDSSSTPACTRWGGAVREQAVACCRDDNPGRAGRDRGRDRPLHRAIRPGAGLHDRRLEIRRVREIAKGDSARPRGPWIPQHRPRCRQRSPSACWTSSAPGSRPARCRVGGRWLDRVGTAIEIRSPGLTLAQDQFASGLTHPSAEYGLPVSMLTKWARPGARPQRYPETCGYLCGKQFRGSADRRLPHSTSLPATRCPSLWGVAVKRSGTCKLDDGASVGPLRRRGRQGARSSATSTRHLRQGEKCLETAAGHREA